jgi:hypothetical protein
MHHVTVDDVRAKDANDLAQAQDGARIGNAAMHAQFVERYFCLPKLVGHNSPA